MKTFIFYENNPEATMEQFMEVYPRHQENEEKFVKAGIFAMKELQDELL